MFDEKLSAELFVRKIAIPGVREGSIIDLKYTIFDEGVGLPINKWVFQNPTVPTLWSEFESSVPVFIEYKKFSQGWTPFALAKEDREIKSIQINYIDRESSGLGSSINSTRNIKIEYETNTMHFVQEHVPALKAEAFVASVHDYLSSISFDVRAIYNTDLIPSGNAYKLVNSSAKNYNRTWTGIGRDLLEDVYAEHLSGSKYTGAETETCISGKTNTLDKTNAILEYIGKNYHANAKDYFWPSQSVESLTKNKKGSTTDINLLFINMLRRAKINAYPVLLSSRSHGRALSFHVSAQEFDRVISAVALDDSTLTLLDAAAWPSPIGILPVEDLNGEGLLLKDKANIDWIPLQNISANRSAIIADFNLLPNGTLEGKLTFSETGHSAVHARKSISQSSEIEFLKGYFKGLLEDGKAANISIEGAQDWQNPSLKGSFSLETAAFATVSGNKIYLNPMLSFGLKETPFKNPDRKFGVDFGPPVSRTMVFSFKIPPGYTLEEAPKSAKISFEENALGFDYMVDRSNPELVKVTIRQNIRSPFISTEQFADLQQFYAMMVAKMAEQLVLIKS